MLKLIELQLQGFGCFKDTTIFNYENAINLVKAQNGKGKSTMLQAIEMLLLSSYEGAFSDYLYRDRERDIVADEFTASLEFILDNYHLLETLIYKKSGKTYITTRNLKDLTTDKDLANGENVKEWLEQKLPVSTSKYALFVRQNSNLDIITCTDSERRELFKRIQDLDFSKEIDTLITPKIEQVKEKIIEVDKEIFALENKKYEVRDFIDIPFTEDEYTLKKNTFDKLNAEKALIEERKVRYEELFINKNKIANEITSLENISKNRQIGIADYNKFIENAESEKDKIISKCEENKVQIENNISSLNAEIDNLDDEKKDKIQEINSNITDIEKEIEFNKNEVTNIKLIKLIKFDESSLIKARNDLSELKTKSSIAWKNAEQLKTGICPCCGRSGCEHKYQELADEATSYDKQILECEGTIDDLLQKKNSYEESLKRNQENREHKIELESQLSKLEERLSIKKDSLNNIDALYESKTKELQAKIASEEQKRSADESKCTSDCKAIDEKVKLYKKQKLEYESIISENEKKVAELNSELKQIATKLSEYEDSTNKINFSEIDSLSIELKKYNDTISQNRIIKEYNQEIESIKKADKIELDKLKEKKQKFEQEIYNLTSAKNIMIKDYPNFVIENSIQNVENDINEFIDDTYYKSLDIHFESTKTGIKMTFGGNAKIPIKRLSGAERALCNVAFVSSFNRNMGLNLVCFDEIDASLSDSMKSELYNAVLNMKDLFEQIIIVTHSEKMTNYMIANNGDINIIEL